MSFKLKFHKDSTTGLVVVCDSCDHELKADEANIIWKPGEEKPGEYLGYAIVCKECDNSRLITDSPKTYWQPLSAGLIYLLHNANVNMKESAKSAELLSKL